MATTTAEQNTKDVCTTARAPPNGSCPVSPPVYTAMIPVPWMNWITLTGHFDSLQISENEPCSEETRNNTAASKQARFYTCLK
jgi:hypothetical protein